MTAYLDQPDSNSLKMGFMRRVMHSDNETHNSIFKHLSLPQAGRRQLEKRFPAGHRVRMVDPKLIGSSVPVGTIGLIVRITPGLHIEVNWNRFYAFDNRESQLISTADCDGWAMLPDEIELVVE